MQIILHGCGQMAEKLRQMGYEVVDESTAADAMLYFGNKIPEFPASGNGTLLVNVTNKSPEEVDQILQSRLYHPLFEKEKYF